MLSSVDGVIICTPNSSHCSLALDAMKRGKHFLLEKPLGVSEKECLELALLSRDYATTKMVGVTNRFSPLVKRAKEYMERMGRVYSIVASTGRNRLSDPNIPLEWRMKRDLSGSGALCDFGSHLLDLSHYLSEKSMRVSQLFPLLS